MVSRDIDPKGKEPMRARDDMFNADIAEAESFDVGRQKHTERNSRAGMTRSIRVTKALVMAESMNLVATSGQGSRHNSELDGRREARVL